MEIIQVPLDKIEFKPSIQTAEFKENLARLKDSIESQGLFHPITVRPPNNNVYQLASGEKRLLVFKELKKETIPCVIRAIEENEPEQLTHIHENLMRFNLPWYDQCELERQLHNLRIEQYGQARSGRPDKSGRVGWSLRDTAKELDMGFGILSEDIKIAEIIEADPSYKKIGDKTTARRIILNMLKQMSQEAEASMDVEETDTFEINKVYLGSSEEVLKSFPQNTFHLCLTDPPWMKFIDEKYTSDEFTLSVFEQVFRVMSVDSFLFMFVSTDDFALYKKELPKFGFKIQQYPNIWIKEGHLTRGKRSWEFERDVEPVLVAVKGSPALTSSMLSSIFSCKIVPPVLMTHPNEKPKEVIKWIMNAASYDSALVLDPFAGSGVVGEVAREMKRRYVLVERDKYHYHKIVKRLEKIK